MPSLPRPRLRATRALASGRSSCRRWRWLAARPVDAVGAPTSSTGPLRRWLSAGLPLLASAVRARALAAELATLDHARPQRRPAAAVRPADDARIAVVQSMPADLTPADTSSTVPPTLASALRRRLRRGGDPLPAAPARPTSRARRGAGLRPRRRRDVLRTSAGAGGAGRGGPGVRQADRHRRPAHAVGPARLPSARTHVCSYGILPPSMEALAAALLGEAPFVGRLPVDIAGLYPRGHELEQPRSIRGRPGRPTRGR